MCRWSGDISSSSRDIGTCHCSSSIGESGSSNISSSSSSSSNSSSSGIIGIAMVL